MPIQIAIAEDNSFALAALKERLSNKQDIRIKYVAYNGKELLNYLKYDHNVDLILMDIEMPELNGVATTIEVKRIYPHIKVLMLTMFDNDEMLFDSIMAGASGYLLKEDNATQIHDCIIDTVGGGASMSPLIAMKALNLIRQPIEKDTPTQDFGLTQREIELLSQFKNGLTYEEVASNLHISYHTVRKHIENIYRKLNVNNKLEAVKKANENRLL
jgi:DNA-binding NarL/FixJ family response regulator